MTYNQMKARLELVKVALGCLALIVIIIASCENRSVATATLNKVIQLETVVQEASQVQQDDVSDCEE